MGSGVQISPPRCNYRQPQPDRCPQCGSGRIRYFGLGTERVEKAIHQRWPDVRTLRWDRDTTRNYAAHAAILDLFSTGLAHVLVGTQMIAKGLDLPLVTVVGVISADTALNLPDLRSGERTFQLLTQVAGRAGRGLLGGRVILHPHRCGKPRMTKPGRLMLGFYQPALRPALTDVFRLDPGAAPAPVFAVVTLKPRHALPASTTLPGAVVIDRRLVVVPRGPPGESTLAAVRRLAEVDRRLPGHDEKVWRAAFGRWVP